MTRLLLGDCLDILPQIPDQSVDCIISDPPYPEIDRPYGRMTEPEWHAMMRGVVAESRRILKPTGSAVFILQPNSEKVGRMRPWLWEFMAWTCREWNMVQDAWWWNPVVLPSGGAATGGLLRPSLKACVWLGKPDCFRDQLQVLWGKGEYHRSAKAISRSGIERMPSGHAVDVKRCMAAAEKRGGVTPYNVFPVTNSHASGNASGDFGHGAGTPYPLADWWTRYISPPDGVICDPFMGSGTMGLAAIARGREFIGIERDAGYFAIAEKRIREAENATPLLTGATA